MTVMTISEARAALPDVVNRVEAGEEVTITRHGRAVAVIVRPDVIWHRPPADRLRAAAEGLERILQEAAESGISAGGLTEQYAEELIADIRAGRDAR
jgi:antitoxin (DNA-binding transcriptional repressor) of toxin-antitoxin stability system